MAVRLLTWAERPDLRERGPDSAAVSPEYNLHADVFDDWWEPLLDELPDGIDAALRSVAEWEAWIGLALPESGDYVFPAGLAPLRVDRQADRASYWEPNVWMIHPELA